MKYALAVAAVAAVLALHTPALASTQFLAYEGRDSIHEGEGGNKKVVDGVDFWLMGSPPHRFQVIGMLVDERWESGLYGLVRVANLEHDIAKQVKAAGGDAVILDDQHDKVWGVSGSSSGFATYGNGSAWGSSFSNSHPYGTKNSRYVVVKYLPDAPARPLPAPAPAVAAPAVQPPPAAQLPQAEPSAQATQQPAQPVH